MRLANGIVLDKDTTFGESKMKTGRFQMKSRNVPMT